MNLDSPAANNSSMAASSVVTSLRDKASLAQLAEKCVELALDPLRRSVEYFVQRRRNCGTIASTIDEVPDYGRGSPEGKKTAVLHMHQQRLTIELRFDETLLAREAAHRFDGAT